MRWDRLEAPACARNIGRLNQRNFGSGSYSLSTVTLCADDEKIFEPVYVLSPDLKLQVETIPFRCANDDRP